MPDSHANHAHHDHSHSLGNTSDGRRRVAFAACLTASFMVAEVIGGLVSGSLALLADAAHMLTDAGSLGLAWLGFRLAERPADASRSFGWARFKVLAAFVNGMALLVLAVWIVAEAVTRLLDPQPVIGGLIMAVACLGLIVNVIAFKVLHGGDQNDLNMQGAVWHVAGDLLGSVAAIVAAAVIMLSGWVLIDPLLSVLVAAIVFVGGVRLVRRTGHILIEGVPPGLSLDEMIEDLETHIPGAKRVQHLHAWALNERHTLVTLDVMAGDGACPETLRQAVKARLKTRFDIGHATVEVLANSADENGPNTCR